MISSLDKLECVDNFCYLGDLIGAGGGAEKTSRARVRFAWSTGSSVNIKGSFSQMKRKVYRACIQSVLGYASETWIFESRGYGKIEENRTNDGQVNVLCSLKE